MNFKTRFLEHEKHFSVFNSTWPNKIFVKHDPNRKYNFKIKRPDPNLTGDNKDLMSVKLQIEQNLKICQSQSNVHGYPTNCVREPNTVQNFYLELVSQIIKFDWLLTNFTKI